ncbi:MAG: hypothetical protein IH991_10025 [Planctomycetes bacterium]|nr:hypothetical protein [Planctomycetota bacterium]
MISDNRKAGMIQSRLAFGDDLVPTATEDIVEVIEDRVLALNAWQARNSWIDQESTEDCFSDDPNVLAAFVEHTVEQCAERDRLLSHFLECDRCSFAVSELLRATDETCDVQGDGRVDFDDCSRGLQNDHFRAAREPVKDSEWISWFESLGLRPDGPTVFPDLTVADTAWEFGNLLTHSRRQELLETITNASIEKLRSLQLSRSLLLVAFSDTMHALSVAIAGGMKELMGSDLDIHVVGVKRFHEPCLLSKSSVVKNKSVIILTDVVHEGRLLHKLWDIVQSQQPYDIHAMTLVNQHYNGPFADKLIYLGREQKEVRSRIGTLPEARRSLRFFDPVSGVSLQDAASEEESRWDQNDIEEWVPFIERTGAFKKNLRIGKCTYPFAINVLTLLKDEQCRKHIVNRATEVFSSFDPQKRWMFVYPASRGRRAGKIAALFADATGWQRRSLGTANDSNFMHVSQETQRSLEACDGVIIVDAAIRTGDTLRSQAELLRESGITNIVAFYVLDLRRERDRRVHEKSIGVPINSFCCIPLGFGPTNSVKSLLKRRFKELEKHVASANVGSASKDAVRSFCDKVLRQRKGSRHAAPFAKTVQPEDIIKELEKGAVPPSDIIEHVATGRRPNLSLTGFFNSDQAFEDEHQARDARYSINNSASPGFIQELALLFAAQGDFSWLTKNWLVLHEKILTKEESQWQFLAGIAFDARSKDAAASRSLRTAFENFRESLRDREKSERAQLLFDPEVGPPVFEERCATLIELLK